MRRVFPFSLLFFAAAGVLFLLQTIPQIGIILMVLAAGVSSPALINLGMIGTAMEAWTGRVSRLWLVLPIAFYGGYWSVVAREQIVLARLRAAYDGANASVTFPFDPARNALVFEEDRGEPWLVKDFDIPVTYSMAAKRPDDLRSHRMIDEAVCKELRFSARSGALTLTDLYDGEGAFETRRREKVCGASMPEKPELPMVRVSYRQESVVEDGLSVDRTTTTITGPDGPSVRLLGGWVAPLTWFPMPWLGCGLNSAAPSWDCGVGFLRRETMPIVSGSGRFGRDRQTLARTLGLGPVPPSDRRGSDAAVISARVETVVHEVLAGQLTVLDAMIADPLARPTRWEFGLLETRPDVLETRAEALMDGLERAAAAVTEKNSGLGRDSGGIFAGLIADLPRDRLVEFAPRLLALCSYPRGRHWFWSTDRLIRRLGDLGLPALPCLSEPNDFDRSIDITRIEGLCRIGRPVHDVAEPVLLGMWNLAREPVSRENRDALYVAMRRIGITPPPPAAETKSRFAELAADWADVTPASPTHVCAASFEREDRRLEKQGIPRRGNRF